MIAANLPRLTTRSLTLAASPSLVRAVVIGLTAAALLLALLATGTPETRLAVSVAGTDLTRLLRAMAAIKAGIATGVLAAVIWRLGSTVTLPWLATYTTSCAAMAAGPVLIWGMVHVAAGTVLLHGGLLATIAALWRDPGTTQRLAALIATRRAGRSR